MLYKNLGPQIFEMMGWLFCERKLYALFFLGVVTQSVLRSQCTLVCFDCWVVHVLNKELCGQNLTSLVQAGTSMYLIKYFIQYFFQYVLANWG